MANDEEAKDGVASTTNWLATLLGSVAGVALLFYLIGFTVVQSFLYGNRLEGFFVLSREFYEAAGAQFLLELVRAPLWSPLIVGPYVLLLVLLIPPPLEQPLKRLDGIPLGSLIRFFVLLVISIVTYAYCLSYSVLIQSPFFVGLVDRIVWDPSENNDPSAKLAFGFFAIATPLVVAGIVLLRDFRRYAYQRTQTGYLYKGAAFVYVAFLAMLPIAFGMHLYDWKIVEVSDPAHVTGLLTEQEMEMTEEVPVRAWLIGEFSERYVFVKRIGLLDTTVIRALDKDQIHRLSLETRRIDRLTTALESFQSGPPMEPDLMPIPAAAPEVSARRLE